MKIEEIKIDLLKKYASFLYKGNLNELVSFYHRKNNKSNLYPDLSEAQISTLGKREIELYLINILKDSVIDDINSWIADLKEKSLTDKFFIAIDEFYIRHLIFNRKVSLIHFLPEFTNDAVLIVSIINEIEYLTRFQEDMVNEYFALVQKEKRHELAVKNRLIENELTRIKNDCAKSESIAHVGHWKLDYGSGRIQCSEEIYALLGIEDHEDLSWEKLKSFITNENNYVQFLENLPQGNENKTQYSHQLQIRKRDNTIRELISMDYPYYDSAGNVTGIKVFIQDITEAKLIEENLKKNMELTQKILQNSPTLINIYDVEKDEIVYSNGAQQNIFGTTPKQVMDTKFTALLEKYTHPEDKSKLIERFNTLKELNDNEFGQFEYRLFDVNGNIVWLYSRAIVFKRTNGKVSQVLLNALNVTDLKKSEEELKYVEGQLKEAQKIAHIGSYDWDIANDVITYTEEIYRIFDFPLEKKRFKLSDFKSRLKLGEGKKFEEKLKKAFVEDSGYEVEYRIRLPDKTEKDIVSRARIERDDAGNPIRVIGTAMDITSIKIVEYELRKRNEEIEKINNELEESQEEIEKINSDLESLIAERTKELKESEQHYRFLIENVPQIFWTARPEGAVDFYNQKWYEFTGATPEQTVGRGWQQFIHQDDLENVVNALNKSYQTGNILEIEYRLRRADGVYKWRLGRSLPLKDRNGEIIKWMGTSTDIDEQKKHSEELKHKNIQLTTINNDLDSFIYVASHDLRVPISNIEGLLYTLKTEMSEQCKIEGENLTILNMIDESVKKFKNIILDLTEISRVQKIGGEPIRDNNIADEIKEIMLMLEYLIKTSSATIKTDFTACPVIRFSGKNFRSILYNLLSNAIKYRSPERLPNISMSTTCLKDYVLFTIKDNGEGIDSSQIPKIFEMFRRLHNRAEGSGVGLYLVKRIITNAGGKIEVESEKGKGSVFKVYFKY